MRLRLWLELKWKSPQYLLDRILHKRSDPSEEFFNAYPIKYIFLIRKPIDTIRSALVLGRKGGFGEFRDPEKFTQYYFDRLKDIKELAYKLPRENWILILSEDIVNETDTTLKQIEKFLHLKEPLSREYKIFPKTGATGIGDSSQNIKTGRILKQTSTSAEQIEMDEALVQKAENAYKSIIHFLDQLKVP